VPLNVGKQVRMDLNFPPGKVGMTEEGSWQTRPTSERREFSNA